MPLDSEIVVVSGLPRSGTSLMMQMLHHGGVSALTDEERAADADNPRGYFEFERVKKIRDDPTWIPAARGRAVKMVSLLLYDLPATESYRIVFMRRDIDEVLASQVKMLQRLGRPAASIDQMKRSFAIHLKRLFDWLPRQTNMRVLEVSYNRLMSSPQPECGAVSQFLDRRPDVDRMLAAIDPGLYRNRAAANAACQPGAGGESR